MSGVGETGLHVRTVTPSQPGYSAQPGLRDTALVNELRQWGLAFLNPTFLIWKWGKKLFRVVVRTP